ncbi:MAG: tRNA lysidine(34) synthetase TilS [Desulfobacterales bacterium C00003104]|nr:MAG: tRNA lysidine(34) synthetase TilS [Desulfobacterales bacterium C00003104]
MNSFATTENSRAFVLAVEKTIRRHNMFAPGALVLAGVSGGPDSVALLHVLASIAHRWSLRLHVACLNHNLRDAAKDETRFVADLCERLSIPCEIGSRDVASYQSSHHMSVQQAARELRYRFFEKTAARYSADKIALGHHCMDNAESVLMNLLRGSGPLGLSGIPPVRDNRYVRPLIDMTPDEILGFLKINSIEYMVDESNKSRKYLRNRIRHELICDLEREYNPNLIRHLHNLSSILREEEDFWEKTVTGIFHDLTVIKKEDFTGLDLAGLRNLHPALAKRVIRKGIMEAKGDLNRIEFKHIEAIQGLVTCLNPSRAIDMPGGVCVMREPEMLVFCHDRPGDTAAYCYYIDDIGKEVYIREVNALIKSSLSQPDQSLVRESGPCCVFLDLDAVRFPLTVRNFLSGDRFRPIGMSGTRKLKDFFIDEKLPIRLRRLCPIVLSRETIIWIGGHRLSDQVKIRSRTRKVLKLELVGYRL